MVTVLIVFHIIVSVCLIGSVLLQRSEGGLGGMGGSGAMGGMMSVRGSANFLTRLTGILAALFIGLSLVLAIMARGGRSSETSILDSGMPAAPVSAPATTGKGKVLEGSVPAAAQAPSAPKVPEAE